MPRSLDLVVTSVATRLMEATASTATQVSEKVLAQLVEQLDLDGSFLRHHDHDIRASVLVAEWPPRVDVPDPDPKAVIHFTSADPVLALVRAWQEAGGDKGGSDQPLLAAPVEWDESVLDSLGGRCAAGLGGDDHWRARHCQVRRPEVEARRDQHPRGRRGALSRSSRPASRPRKSFDIWPSTTT